MARVPGTSMRLQGWEFINCVDSLHSCCKGRLRLRPPSRTMTTQVWSEITSLFKAGGCSLPFPLCIFHKLAGFLVVGRAPKQLLGWDLGLHSPICAGYAILPSPLCLSLTLRAIPVRGYLGLHLRQIHFCLWATPCSPVPC